MMKNGKWTEKIVKNSNHKLKKAGGYNRNYQKEFTLSVQKKMQSF